MNDSFIGGEMMILRTGDLNPNRFAQGYAGMESFKQAMLQHELIFRNQVRELHRLYWTQKNLMNDIQWKWFDAHAPSSSSRVAMTKCKGSTEDRKEFSESSCARETQNVGSLEQFKGRPADVFSNHVINFSLHIPAGEFIRGTCEDLLPYSHTEIEVSKSKEIVDVTEKGNLGCGFKEVIIGKDICRSASSFSCEEVFDMEASVELECHEEANEVFYGFRAPIQKGTGMLVYQPTAFSDQVYSSTVGNKMHHIPSIVHLDEGHGERLPAIPFVRLGDSCVANLVDHSRIIQEDKPLLIDLNAPLADECSDDLNDSAEDIILKFGSSVVHDGILEHDQSNRIEASFVPKLASSNSVTKTSFENQADCLSCHDQGSKPFSSLESLNTTKDKGNTVNIVGTKVIASSCQVQVECCGKPVEGSTDSNDGAFINVNAVFLSPINACKPGKMDVDFPSDKLPSAAHSDNKMQDSNITSSNSNNLPQSVIRDSVNKLGSYEGSEEDTLSSHATTQDEAQRHAPFRKFPAGFNSDGITRKNKCKSQDIIAKEPVILSNTDDSVTTQLNSSQNDGSSVEKLMLVEGDLTIAAAAEALMSISSERSAFPIDQHRNGVELIEVDCDNGNNQPLHSSDSFECMTLQLSEVQTEDHLSISEPPNLTETEKNVNGLRLRRGRGLRDFQKEILPGLASLARHEICEDLHNIGHKLRRTASRNARENWFVPVQGRRTRLCSGRQRG